MKFLLTLTFISLIFYAYAQPKTKIFTRQDTLRGTEGPFRKNWDVLHYEISVQPDINSKTISGYNKMTFFDHGTTLMQVDLQEPMLLDSAVHQGKKISFTREGNVYWVMLRDTAARYKIKPGEDAITFYFHGKPVEAKRPPWDGGWIWRKDKNGSPFLSIACQGLGASVWYPCKDYQGDEPDKGALLHIVVPDSLVGVGNGRLSAKTVLGNGLTRYSWAVTNPINNYNIIPYIGKYTHFGEIYKGLSGKLNMDYWVLDYNLDTARKQFWDAIRMMKAFEYWFGPYPFYKDGFKLVEAPHLGMEHQSGIAYGNNYQNGYLGTDLSGSGWGEKWDFIIIHEAGHEWFGNNITTREIADMWVHEGFTNYSETLFTDYYYGKEAGNDYVIGSRKNIANDIPIIGHYGVNQEGSGDMYPKAANMIHMIRQLVNDDRKFRNMLVKMNKTFYHKTVSGLQVMDFMQKESKLNLTKIFEQYLTTTQVPVLEYKISGPNITHRWVNAVEGFNMPVKVNFHAGSALEKWIRPTTEWKTEPMGSSFDGKTVKINRNFYVSARAADK